MALEKLVIDFAALGKIAKGDEMQGLVRRAAEGIAKQVEDQGITVGDENGGDDEVPLPVKVITNTTDRARATVLLAHSAGVAVQAKRGALTRAASTAGHTIRTR